MAEDMWGGNWLTMQMMKELYLRYFGLFIYDLKNEKIIFNTDLNYSVGTNVVQGSTYASVGEWWRKNFNAYQNDTQTTVNKQDITALYVNIQTGEHYFAPYKEFDKIISLPKLSKSSFIGSTIGELKYFKNDKEYLLFDKFKH